MTMPIDIFVSYESADKVYRSELERHLASLQSRGAVRVLDPEQIPAGEHRIAALHQQIDEANLVLLLVSPDFLSSRHCRDIQMSRIAERWRRREIWVIPVILRDCNWQGALAGFEHVKMLPENARPITHWPQRDQAWASVVHGIDQTVAQMKIGPSPV